MWTAIAKGAKALLLHGLLYWQKVLSLLPQLREKALSTLHGMVAK